MACFYALFSLARYIFPLRYFCKTWTQNFIPTSYLLTLTRKKDVFHTTFVQIFMVSLHIKFQSPAPMTHYAQQIPKRFLAKITYRASCLPSLACMPELSCSLLHACPTNIKISPKSDIYTCLNPPFTKSLLADRTPKTGSATDTGDITEIDGERKTNCT